MANMFIGTSGNDFFVGTDENDIFVGNGGVDTFYGEGGNDVFQGNPTFSSVPKFLGGTGNDTYIFMGWAQTIVEYAGEGIDTVKTVSDLSLHDNFENLILLQDTTATVGNGNDLNNVITGNTRDNQLYGNGANDVLIGGVGADVLNGGNGIDTASYATASAAVSASLSAAGSGGDAAGDTCTLIENLLGSAFADRLIGNNGVNTLTGGAGNDTLAGLASNDLLLGGTGNDLLNGGLGKDRLIGGAGRDNFVFANAPSAVNLDTIVGYNVAQDTIRLDNAVFTQISGLGTLTSAQFWKSTTGLAHDANDRVIYETDTGKLFYDSNGSALGGRSLIAVLSNHAAIGNADIFII